MALHAHEFHVAVEGREVGGHGDAGLPGLFPVSDRRVEDEAFVPADEGVAQQAGDVVAHRSVERVLIVDDARIRVGHHEVARHEVAVHEHLRFAQIVFNDGVNRHLPPAVFLLGEGVALVASHVPFGKEVHFAQEHFAVVFGQNARTGNLLPGDERRRRVVHEGEGVLFVEHVEIGFTPEIGEKQKAFLEIRREDLGSVQSRLVHERGHAHKGVHPAVFGRRVHHDEGGAVLARHAEITAKARVGARGLAGRIGAKSQRGARLAEPGEHACGAGIRIFVHGEKIEKADGPRGKVPAIRPTGGRPNL